MKLFKQRYRAAKTNKRGPWLRLTTCYSPEQMAAIHAVARAKDCTAAFAIRYLVDVGLAVEQESRRTERTGFPRRSAARQN